jgi:HTH-type transcriptional regulator / antitoxin HipB
MINTAKDFGALIRHHRKKLGITQIELASRCGTGERFIVDLENGKPSCHLEKALIAAHELGINLIDKKETAHSTDSSYDGDELDFLPDFSRRSRS